MRPGTIDSHEERGLYCKTCGFEKADNKDLDLCDARKK